MDLAHSLTAGPGADGVDPDRAGVHYVMSGRPGKVHAG